MLPNTGACLLSIFGVQPKYHEVERNFCGPYLLRILETVGQKKSPYLDIFKVAILTNYVPAFEHILCSVYIIDNSTKLSSHLTISKSKI